MCILMIITQENIWNNSKILKFLHMHDNFYAGEKNF